MPAEKKQPSTRRRTNVAGTRATLRAVDPDEPVEIPPMPTRFKSAVDDDPQSRTYGEIIQVQVTYSMETILTWESWWMSPMRQEWTDADYRALCRLIVLEDRFWKGEDVHSEIRLAQKDFGLTPYDRRRLEWTIEQTEEAQDKGAKRRRQNMATNNGATPTSSDNDDPRADTA